PKSDTASLPDALPISGSFGETTAISCPLFQSASLSCMWRPDGFTHSEARGERWPAVLGMHLVSAVSRHSAGGLNHRPCFHSEMRSEEHTSELQSRENL